MDAIEELMNETGLKAADVEEVIVHATRATVSHGGWTYAPAGLTSAQMNLGFCIAMQLSEGEVFVDQMVEQNIARPDLVDLAKRVKAKIFQASTSEVYGDPENGEPPGRTFGETSPGYSCPVCGSPKESFVPIEKSTVIQ